MGSGVVRLSEGVQTPYPESSTGEAARTHEVLGPGSPVIMGMATVGGAAHARRFRQAGQGRDERCTSRRQWLSQAAASSVNSVTLLARGDMKCVVSSIGD